VYNNLFYDCGHGVNFSNGANPTAMVTFGYNYFSACTVNYEGIPDQPSDVDDGTTDPFTDSAGRDYTLASGSNALAAGIDAGAF